jgi:GDP-mannose 6-dehydrogenase
MRLFCMDTQLNISPYYFKPGFAYGGSCLPKDLKALKTIAHDNYIQTPVLSSIENSNVIQKQAGLHLIEKWEKKKVLVLGIAFKAGTDDLRFSPIIDVIETLLGRGYDMKLYDRNVSLSRLLGENKSYIMEKLPHISNLLIEDLEKGISEADIIVFNNKEKEFLTLNIPADKRIVDLCRIEQYRAHPGYEGISW